MGTTTEQASHKRIEDGQATSGTTQAAQAEVRQPADEFAHSHIGQKAWRERAPHHQHATRDRQRPRLSPKYRIAFLVGGSVAVTLLLMLLIFNVGTQMRMEHRAAEAMDAALAEDYDEDQSSMYYAELIFLPDEDTDWHLRMYSRRTEKKIINWCAANHPGAKLQRVRIGGKTYYLKSIRAHSEDFGTYTCIAYIDITGEPELIRRINIIFLLAAVWIGILGSVIGYLVGQRLERIDAAQKKFFENASHELKTPLTAMQGYAEGIEKGIITDYPKAGGVIAAQTEKMRQMVEGILLLSRLEGGALPLEKETLEVADFLEDCLLPLEGAITQKGIAVDLDLRPGRIAADPERLDSAITNLLTNAIKFADSTIRLRCDGRHLTIWNDCPEVPPEDLAHLFDRFYTGKHGSTGIGLALAREIIQLHDFTIEARNEDGGLTVEVQF